MFDVNCLDELMSSLLTRVLLVRGRKLEFRIEAGTNFTDVIAVQHSGRRVKVATDYAFRLRALIRHLLEKHSRKNHRSLILNESGECNLRRPLFNVKFTMPEAVQRFGHPFVISTTPSADGYSAIDITITVRYLESKWETLEI
ncbi:hypothetical protein [Shewanella xiamenensis]|uniref:Uncharacterized protein n=1 Tax=Shewanella xiamenensis TaxID=332186 RepID=A0ABT6UDR1_9GAMM|nr:hypothetical protein [Shewanella xiamenensis]MDI5832607.1 hypothetical protein [Shewanella xiamenensis]